jgi:hypothetical protein
MTEDINFDYLSAMKSYSREHACEWVEHQKVLLKKWRKIIEDRKEDDEDLFKQWGKSWMATGFKMLELHSETHQRLQQARLDQIDRYLKHLDEVECEDDDDKSGKSTS